MGPLPQHILGISLKEGTVDQAGDTPAGEVMDRKTEPNPVPPVERRGIRPS